MYRHILLAVDLGDESSWRKALPVSAAFCKAFEATLHVVTIVPDFGMNIVGQFFPDDYAEKAVANAREQLHAFVRRNVPGAVKVQHIVGYGTIYQEILRISEDIECDLIVIASHRPELSDYLLGPNAARVVRHSARSVLVVRGE